MSKIVISESLVRNSILSLKRSRGFGSDKIPMIFWIKTIEPLLKPMTKLFNIFANKPFIPYEWKTITVIPIYKRSVSKADCKNYRPIALQRSLAKIFEKTLL